MVCAQAQVLVSRLRQSGDGVLLTSGRGRGDVARAQWEEFRGDVLGPTDPATAPKDSLRGKIMVRRHCLARAPPPWRRFDL